MDIGGRKKWQSKVWSKGKSVIGEYIELPQCVQIDYMHSVLEGVFKQLTKRWFEQTFHGKQYSLRKKMSAIDK